jgi:hypothetical protein
MHFHPLVPSQPVYLRSILVLSPDLLCCMSNRFTKYFSTEILHTSELLEICLISLIYRVVEYMKHYCKAVPMKCIRFYYNIAHEVKMQE